MGYGLGFGTSPVSDLSGKDKGEGLCNLLESALLFKPGLGNNLLSLLKLLLG